MSNVALEYFSLIPVISTPSNQVRYLSLFVSYLLNSCELEFFIMCGPLTVDLAKSPIENTNQTQKSVLLYCLDFVFPIFMFNIVKHLE